jgi:hypothetical protein
MKLTRRGLRGIGVALTFLLVATPASAAWTNFGLGHSPSPDVATDAYPPDIVGDGLATVPGSEDSEELQDEIAIGPTQLDTNPPDLSTDDILQAPALADLLDGTNDVETQITQVPEPGTLALIALSLGGLGWRTASRTRSVKKT